MDIAKKERVGGKNLGEIQELKDITSEDNMMKTSASEPVREKRKMQRQRQRKRHCQNAN